MIQRRDFLKLSAGLIALGLTKPGLAALPQSTVFHNGTILPVDEQFSQHSAMAIRGNRILGVGDAASMLKLAGERARLVDLKGAVVLPGFIEPHMHFSMLAGLGHLEDIGPFQRGTFEEALNAIQEIKEAAAEAEEDSWVMARQFDPILLDPPRDLTIRDLDPIVPDKPCFILNASGHVAYANSALLKKFNVSKDTKDPPGASYGRFEDGTPNGVLYGKDIFLPMLLANKSIADRMASKFVEAGVEVGDGAVKHGITTLCDQGTGGLAGPGEVSSYQEMYKNGMKSRIRAYIIEDAKNSFEKSDIGPGHGDALMRVCGWKIVTDGSNQGFTGRQRYGYHTRDTVGIFYVKPDELKKIVEFRAKQGWQLSLHGNGDAAIDSILDAVEAAKEQGIDVEALRCRIEHCSILHDEQIARMKELGMGASFLINHVHYWGHVMRDEVFGPKKVQLLDRCASVEKAGVPFVNHTDAPVSPLDSLHKIRVAVVRDMWKEPDTILAPQERISVESAIRSVTSTAAWLCHSEHEIGSLETGKLADMVVLDKDPRKVDPREISDLKVLQTWMDGNLVYES
jgi:predicted amidohydrolase YtcJ